MQRPIHRFSILARHRERQSIAAPEDFSFDLAGPAQPVDLRRRALLYCFNLRTERALYTELPDDFRDSVFAQPFLYGAQLDQALCAYSVPFERLFQIESENPPPEPVMIFSPGRTGSTLLARLVDRLCGRAASEPDSLTRLALMTGDERPLLPDYLAYGLVRASIASLARFLGPRPVIKLRSQCNTRADLLMNAVPAGRAVFLLRDRLGFGCSRHRAFGEDGAAITSVLAETLLAIAYLHSVGRDVDILWYDDMLADPWTALECVLGAAEARRLRAAGGAKIVENELAGDSQEGSGISRFALAEQKIASSFIESFNESWNAWRASPLNPVQQDGMLEPILARLG